MVKSERQILKLKSINILMADCFFFVIYKQIFVFVICIYLLVISGLSCSDLLISKTIIKEIIQLNV